jgi:acetyl-CoA acyltransferase 1
MSNRLRQIADHVLPGNQTANKVGVKSPEDVVIVSALRTAMTRGRKGGFKDTLPEEMLAGVFKAVIAQTKIDPALVEDICVGNVLPAGSGATNARKLSIHLVNKFKIMAID